MHRIITKEERILEIRGFPVRLQKKNIKSIRLRLIPPHGEIRLSVPHWYTDRKAEDFLLSRWDWVQEQKQTIYSVHPLARQGYRHGDTLRFQGKEWRIIHKTGSRNSLTAAEGTVTLELTGEAGPGKARQMAEAWYRRELKKKAAPMIEHWSRELDVEPADWRIKKMTSCWGSCNVREKRIWLNLELAAFRPEILEYVVLHELVHLLEPSHNKRFKGILDFFMPAWRSLSLEMKGRGDL